MRDLHRAAKVGDLVEIRRLLSLGAQPDARDSHGWTPVHMAAFKGQAEAIHEFLSTGSVDPNLPDSRGWAAIHLAAQEGHHQAIEALLKNGASPSSVTRSGNAALHVAAQVTSPPCVALAP